jgi:hypothetical protein
VLFQAQFLHEGEVGVEVEAMMGTTVDMSMEADEEIWLRYF